MARWRPDDLLSQSGTKAVKMNPLRRAKGKRTVEVLISVVRRIPGEDLRMGQKEKPAKQVEGGSLMECNHHTYCISEWSPEALRSLRRS